MVFFCLGKSGGGEKDMVELANSLVSKFELSDEEGVSLEQSMETDSAPALHDTMAANQAPQIVPTVVTTSPQETVPAACTPSMTQQVRTSNSTRLRSVFCAIL